QAFNGGTTGYLGYGIFRGDNRTFSVTIAVGTDDDELRALIDCPRFDLAAAQLPASKPWIDPAISEPIAPMHVMAGTINRVRDLVIDRRPRVLGYVAVGDAPTRPSRACNTSRRGPPCRPPPRSPARAHRSRVPMPPCPRRAGAATAPTPR